ncbi:MAG: hypothetical protein GY809_21290 [Planctomycetes bacterium]|nr:hypothetical protein [Planctomycetota bacterium]
MQACKVIDQSESIDQKERGSIMNCLRSRTRTGLLALVAVLLVGGMMPVVAGAAEKEAGSFDPFALDAMVAASLATTGNANVSALAPVDERPVVLRTAKLVIPQRPKLRSPFRPGHSGSWK